jgi:hypothetical protein
MATIAFVNHFIEDLNGCTEPVKKKGGRIQTIEKKKGWIAPPVDRTKVNVDAAVSKSVPKGVVGLVCWSLEGVFLGASAMVFDGINQPGCLEALACREALGTAMDLALGPIMVVSDYLKVVDGAW